MFNLMSILRSLRECPRTLTPEETFYVDALRDELRNAQSDAACWAIFEREGVTSLEEFEVNQETLATLETIRRAAMH